MCSAHGSCSSTTKNLVQYQKQKSLSASPVLRCRRQAGQLGAASGRAAGSWGPALLRPCWGLAWGLGLGKGSGTVRPLGALKAGCFEFHVASAGAMGPVEGIPVWI